MRRKQYIWYDDILKCQNGKRKPYYGWTTVEDDNCVTDKQLIWLHEGYGRMGLYRVHYVDDENYIAEDMKISCYTSSNNWKIYSEKPELALERRTA